MTSFPVSSPIKPRRLRPGSRVAAVSLSWGGPGAIPHRYAIGKRQFEEEFGVVVTETEHALRSPAWLARNPRARADDLMAAFADSGVDGIISTIGGTDSIRLLPHIDLSVIRNNPKVFMGYSDRTGSGLAVRAAAAWVSAVRASGRIPLYSTSWHNTASLAVARKLGLMIYANAWSVNDAIGRKPAQWR